MPDPTEIAIDRPHDLTIATVVMPKHYGYVRQQLDLISALNPGQGFETIVVDNAAGGPERLVVDDPRCRVLAGVDPDGFPEAGRGSYHHAAALNLIVPEVKTRFLVVIDPDLFVLYRGWIAECLGHMRRRGLIFFGAPWNYANFRKWRYFPCVHFLIIDLDRVDRSEIDFTPAVAEDHEAKDAASTGWFAQHMPLTYGRSLLESRRDTGWRLHRTFGRRRGIAEVVLPVIDVDAEITRPKYLLSRTAKWIEPRLPPRWSFLPVPGTYVEPEEAPALQHPAIRALAPEAFVWRGAPFAIHLRRNLRDQQAGRTEADDAEEGANLAWLLERVAAAPTWLDWGV